MTANMNPYYNQFKHMLTSGGGNDPGDDIGNVYKSVLYQRGYGFDQEIDYNNTYGLGFASNLATFFRMAMPTLKSGLKFLGRQAVNTAANIANDAIAGENIKDSARKHTKATAEDLFARAPSALLKIINKRGSGNSRKRIRYPTLNWQTSGKKKNKRVNLSTTRKVGHGLLEEYPALGRII